MIIQMKLNVLESRELKNTVERLVFNDCTSMANTMSRRMFWYPIPWILLMTGSETRPIIMESKAICENVFFPHHSRTLVFRAAPDGIRRPTAHSKASSAVMITNIRGPNRFGSKPLLNMENSPPNFSLILTKRFRLTLRMFDRIRPESRFR